MNINIINQKISLETLIKVVVGLSQFFLYYCQLEKIKDLNTKIHEHGQKLTELSCKIDTSMSELRSRLTSSEICTEMIKEKLSFTKEVLVSKIDLGNSLISQKAS